MTGEKEFVTALYDLAREEGKEDAVLSGLETALAVFAQSPDYLKLLSNPSVDKAERVALLEAAFGNKIERYTVNFLKILCERASLSALRACTKEFKARLYIARGILPVLAKCAVPMTQEQEKALIAKLEEMTGKTILLTVETDASLIAGMRISYDGRCYDDTVKQRFESLQRALMGA